MNRWDVFVILIVFYWFFGGFFFVSSYNKVIVFARNVINFPFTVVRIILGSPNSNLRSLLGRGIFKVFEKRHTCRNLHFHLSKLAFRWTLREFPKFLLKRYIYYWMWIQRLLLVIRNLSNLLRDLTIFFAFLWVFFIERINF